MIAEKLYTALLTVESIDDADIDKAKEIFESYKSEGVILNDSFDDNVWKTTDEYKPIGIYFSVDEFGYKRFYEDLLQIPYQDIVLYMKVFVAVTMGKCVLNTINTAVNDIKRLFRTDPEEIYAENAELVIVSPSLVADFLTILPNESEELNRLLNALDFYVSESYANGIGKQRTLAQFDSYLLFNDILKDYWSSDISNEERMFYYPLYLWWNITGVIPLRPREFILTERDCIKKMDDGYYLTLRRNKLKGGKRNVTYKIIGDYETDTYKIPDKLANEIVKYKNFTEQFNPTDISTLFIQDTHYEKWGQKRHSNSRFLTYVNMNTIMKYFFRDVISGKYGLNVVYEQNGGHLEKGEIEFIHLGDTRHLALINVMAEGATPVIAMQLASHDNIDMSAFYYSNITNLIECRTYRQYRLVTKGNVSYEVSKAINKLPIKTDYVVLSDGSHCYSDKYKQSDYSDCKKTLGKYGEVGYCPDCIYHRDRGNEYYRSDDVYKTKILDDCKHLAELVNLYRKGKGDPEDIGQVLTRLKANSYSYQQYCDEKFLLGGTEDNGEEESNFE